MKYMVVACHPGYAVVLTEDGQFIKVANLQYEIGQTVRDVVPMKVPARKPKKWLSSLAAIAACLVLLLTAVLPVSNRVYASVYVKINPEIRIDVDKNDQVVKLEGINDDGTALIQDYNYRRKDLQTVTEELVDLAIQAGFLQSDGSITLTLDSADQLWVTHHTQELSNHVHAHLQNKLSVTVEVTSHHDGHHSAPDTTAADWGKDPLDSGDQSGYGSNHHKDSSGHSHSTHHSG